MSAFCFSPETIDFHLLQLWLSGLSISQASSMREDNDPLIRDLIELDTADHFRLFDELQPVLEEPGSNSCLLELSTSVRRKMSESFYSFDDLVVKEFLGRKMTTRVRKDWLDEVSESTGVPRRSCLRQFDNLRRLYDAADEFGFQIQPPLQTSIAEVLGDEFGLPRHLMERYEAILFLMYTRFNISGKKKLLYVSMKDFEICSRAILNSWCVKSNRQPQLAHPSSLHHAPSEGLESPVFQPTIIGQNTPVHWAIQQQGSSGAMTVEMYSPFEIDPTFLAKFRDLKTRTSASVGEVWASIASSLEASSERKYLESRFKPWLRSLLACVSGRDLKDFFENLIADVVEPLVDMRPELEKLYSLTDVPDRGTSRLYLEALFDSLDRAVPQVFASSDVATWNILISVLRICTIQLAAVHPDRIHSEPEDAGRIFDTS